MIDRRRDRAADKNPIASNRSNRACQPEFAIARAQRSRFADDRCSRPRRLRMQMLSGIRAVAHYASNRDRVTSTGGTSDRQDGPLEMHDKQSGNAQRFE